MEYIITMERLVEDNAELRADLCTLRRRYGFPITDSADPEEREKALNRWVGSAIHDLQAFQTQEADEAFMPIEVGLLGADGVAAQANRLAEAVGNFLLLWRDFPLLTAFSPWNMI